MQLAIHDFADSVLLEPANCVCPPVRQFLYAPTIVILWLLSPVALGIMAECYYTCYCMILVAWQLYKQRMQGGHSIDTILFYMKIIVIIHICGIFK